MASPRSVSQKLNGKKPPKPKTLKAMAKRVTKRKFG
jgi:hypothetical protein